MHEKNSIKSPRFRIVTRILPYRTMKKNGLNTQNNTGTIGPNRKLKFL